MIATANTAQQARPTGRSRCRVTAPAKRLRTRNPRIVEDSYSPPVESVVSEREYDPFSVAASSVGKLIGELESDSQNADHHLFTKVGYQPQGQ